MKIYMIIFVVGSNDITMEKSFSKVLAYCAAFLVLSACSPKGSASGTYESYTDVAEVNGVSLFYDIHCFFFNLPSPMGGD